VKTKGSSLQRSAAYLVYAIVATISLIFGAVHPIVLGCYVFVMLVGFGGWLLYNKATASYQSPSFSTVVPLILIAYLVLQSIPLPLDWLALLSPERFARVRMVNTLADVGLENISLSESGPVGFYRSFFLLALILYYFTIKRLIIAREDFQKTLVYCCVGVGVFQAVYGLVQFLNPHIGILWLAIPERSAHGTVIYKNQYASLLNMIWPLTLSTGVLPYVNRHKKHLGKGLGQILKEKADEFSTANLQSLFMIFATGAMILAILFSLSRGGILAMVLVALLMLVLLPFSKIGKLGCLALIAGLIVGYATLLGLNTIVSRFDSIDNSGAHRLAIYLASLPLLWDHWLTGVGFGSYALLSPIYLKGFPSNVLYDQAHNEYLELLIELGIPAATLLFGWILVGMLNLLKRFVFWQKHGDVEHSRRVLGAAAYCGLVGFLLHGLVDFGWRLPANLVFCTTLLAICVCSLQPKTRPDVSPTKESGVLQP
jgi:O-antigen ligase